MKKQIKLLSYLFLLLIFISSYLEIILTLQYGDPNISLMEPLITPFFWPRLIFAILPSIALIIFSSVRKQWADMGLILWIGIALGHASVTFNSVFHPIKYLPVRNDNVIKFLYTITNSSQFIVLLLIIVCVAIFSIKNDTVLKFRHEKYIG